MQDESREIEKLRLSIMRMDHAYWVDNHPIASDDDYDAAMQRLRDLEKKHPQLQDALSPTMRVGGQVAKGFQSVRHKRGMISLDNAFGEEDLESFFQKVQKRLGRESEWVCEPKLDGLAISLHYRRGRLVQALTRGDGQSGEDITANAKTIREIPLRLLGDGIPDDLEIRGEVFMKKRQFDTLNRYLEKQGVRCFANPRNAAAGSLRQYDSRVTSQRKLSFYAYAAYVEGSVEWPDTHQGVMSRLKQWGVNVNGFVKRVGSLRGAMNFIKRVEVSREDLAYGIDGVVLKVDARADQVTLGQTSKAPRWAIAYKFPAEVAQAQVVGIEAQVGRTGVITPVAEVKPVLVGGVTVRHVTLHNYSEVSRKDIRVGDWVHLRRAGDVIPEIVRVDMALSINRQERTQPVQDCPCCGSALRLDSSGGVLRCVNVTGCQDQIAASVWHFASRKAMAIEGLGQRLVQQLVVSGLVTNIASLYQLTLGDVEGLPNMGTRSAKKVLDAISGSKSAPWPRVLYGLGIREVGYKSADILAGVYPHWRQLAQASPGELSQVEGVGPIVAESIHQYFANSDHIGILEFLEGQGVISNKTKGKKEGPLTGQVYVITGKFNTSRSKLKDLLEDLGADIADGVTQKTTAVIVGDKPGSKVTKAQALEVPCIGIEDLENLLGQHISVEH